MALVVCSHACHSLCIQDDAEHRQAVTQLLAREQIDFGPVQDELVDLTDALAAVADMLLNLSAVVLVQLQVLLLDITGRPSRHG